MYLIFGYKNYQALGGVGDLLEVVNSIGDRPDKLVAQKIVSWIDTFVERYDLDARKEFFDIATIYAYSPENDHYFEAFWDKDNSIKFRTVPSSVISLSLGKGI